MKDLYVTGVNHGFILGQYRTDLIKSLLETDNETIYIDGLRAGFSISQERTHVKRKAELRDIRMKNKDLDLER
ncbi:hypothetical protein [Gilvibacter sediminis]|uniref:hypothetical protein n=1 Tax=Gilvibacter sediminis TaxID=379071 RepID=UPI00234FD5F0|nr:hypothetical protein [Gilvibacter sediminis]MDC7996880.1 hypothetical protein [Gilvibacter sediminis]